MYTDLQARLIARGKPTDRRKLENNTYAERRDGDKIAVRLHNTDVLTFDAAGVVELNTGGWLTVTTKDRMNSYLPGNVRVYSEKGRWYVYQSGQDKIPYFDGMRLDLNTGTVLDLTDAPDVATEDKEIAKTRKAITRYVKGYTDEIIAELAASNGAGDCWFCALHVAGTDKSLGDVSGDHEHLQSHIDDDYRMITTIYSAVNEAGYYNPAMILKIAPGLARRALAKYLRRRLITGVAVR